MTYAAAFEQHADVCVMVFWLEAEGMLSAAKKRDGLKFISDSDIDAEMVGDPGE